MLLVCLSQFELLAVARNAEIFGLGVKDRSFVEFSRQANRRDPIIYRVGVSSAAKDWPGRD